MKVRASDLFTLFIILMLSAAVYTASAWPLRASVIVLVLGSVGIVMACTQLIMDVFTGAREKSPAVLKFELPNLEAGTSRDMLLGSLEIWAWLIGILAASMLIGLQIALPLFVFVYARVYGAGWLMCLLLSALVWAFIFGVYNQIMKVYWPESVLGNYLGY